WIDGQMHLSNVFQQYRVLKNGPDEAVFEVQYAWDDLSGNYSETRRFTLQAGSQLFKVESQIFKDGKPAQVSVAIGVTTHDKKALPYADSQRRWVAAWETLNGQGLGTGVVLPDAVDSSILTITSYEKDHSHILFITPTSHDGRITYYGGFGWEGAGEISSIGAWRSYLTHFSNEHANK
ncbi:MAG: DUF4861 family protein, partial [Verrucomicrobiae bacterium]|nr:DUF4861 family protein [Verrucomicrobiae bacterium]